MAPKKSSLKKYTPLIALTFVAALAAFALLYQTAFEGYLWMHFFMGFFLCQFSMLKLFSLKSFADGFQMYDLIAKKSRFYAYSYPFIELALGLFYLAGFKTVYLFTILILGIGAIGVISALKKGLNVRCACMGTSLNVPLSTVTLVEDLSMVAMAFLLLIREG